MITESGQRARLRIPRLRADSLAAAVTLINALIILTLSFWQHSRRREERRGQESSLRFGAGEGRGKGVGGARRGRGAWGGWGASAALAAVLTPNPATLDKIRIRCWRPVFLHQSCPLKQLIGGRADGDGAARCAEAQSVHSGVINMPTVFSRLCLTPVFPTASARACFFICIYVSVMLQLHPQSIMGRCGCIEVYGALGTSERRS